jgi:hypothetical protein
LLSNDVGHGSGESCIESLLVNDMTVHFGRQHLEHIFRTRQAANMRGKGPIGAVLHEPSVKSLGLTRYTPWLLAWLAYKFAALNLSRRNNQNG